NERTVEIPIALDAVARLSADKPRILEVGHVLQPYADVPRTIVDKYEEAPGVLNVDIVDYAPPERFDLILCLSTLEHVGLDEEPRDPHKALAAYRHLQTLLAPGGELLVTLPAGYHPELDGALADGELGGGAGHRTTALERHGRFNQWRECTIADALARPFGSRYACANGLVIVSWKRGPALANDA
ncbi:MAG: methyltransferase domain-containing protein, partial [Acidobacteriota bacterium]